VALKEILRQLRPEPERPTEEKELSTATGSPIRAASARYILDHCRIGLEELRSHPRGSWFALWAGTLALLRTVLDALEKDADPRIQKAQKRWFDKIKRDNAAAGRGESATKDADTWEPAIFWQFIRRDRNLLLHEAQSNVAITAAVRLGPAAATAGVGEFAVGATRHQRGVVELAGDVSPGPQSPPPAATYSSYTISGRPYTGRDARDLVHEAIEWWEVQIDGIERDAN
jgi:hypothetical protein